MAKKAALVTTDLASWAGRPVNGGNIERIRCDYLLDDGGIGIKFEPLSFDDGMTWHSREGMLSVFVRVEVKGAKISEVNIRAEYCRCGGHDVGGRVPAWLFPSNPADVVDADGLPPKLRKRINCVLGLIAGEPSDTDAYSAWHDKTETGWSLERPLDRAKRW